MKKHSQFPLPLVLIATVLLSGCESASDSNTAEYRLDQSGRAGSEYFATVHSLTVDLPESGVEASYRAVIDYCIEDTRFNCMLLNSELGKRDIVTATLRARISPEGVDEMVDLAARDGFVRNRSTAVEDLAEPIIDMESRVKMLEKHLADLQEIRERSKDDVDALIKVAKEIAQTQSTLEKLRGEHEYLKLRTDLDEVNISFGSYQNRSFFSPISRALGSFVDDLSEGIASAITGFAFLLPWLFVLVPIAFGIRALFRRMR